MRSILAYTVGDLMNRRSLYVALAFCVLFVLFLRGCYGEAITFEGSELDPALIVRHVSRAAFHVIACGSLLLACLLSMRLLGRDREDGTSVMLLSRPVHRVEYLFGRVGGVWVVSSLFMFLMHLSVALLSLLRGGGPLASLLPASLLCSLNLLLLAVLVFLLSLLLPDFLAAFTALLAAAVGFLSEAVFQVMQVPLLQTALGTTGPETTVAPWRSLFPQIAGLQGYAASLLGDGAYHSMGPVPPVLNVLLYTALFTGLLLWRFHHEEL